MADMDAVTKRLNKALDIVLLSYPKRTAFGLLIGFIPAAVLYTFKVAIALKGIIIDWVHYLACEVLGILGMNIKSIAESFRGDAIDEVYGNLLRNIEKRKDISEREKRALITQVFRDQIAAMSNKEVDTVEQKAIDK